MDLATLDTNNILNHEDVRSCLCLNIKIIPGQKQLSNILENSEINAVREEFACHEEEDTLNLCDVPEVYSGCHTKSIEQVALVSTHVQPSTHNRASEISKWYAIRCDNCFLNCFCLNTISGHIVLNRKLLTRPGMLRQYESNTYSTLYNITQGFVGSTSPTGINAEQEHVAALQQSIQKQEMDDKIKQTQRKLYEEYASKEKAILQQHNVVQSRVLDRTSYDIPYLRFVSQFEASEKRKHTVQKPTTHIKRNSLGEIALSEQSPSSRNPSPTCTSQVSVTHQLAGIKLHSHTNTFDKKQFHVSPPAALLPYIPTQKDKQSVMIPGSTETSPQIQRVNSVFSNNTNISQQGVTAVIAAIEHNTRTTRSASEPFDFDPAELTVPHYMKTSYRTHSPASEQSLPPNSLFHILADHDSEDEDESQDDSYLSSIQSNSVFHDADVVHASQNQNTSVGIPMNAIADQTVAIIDYNDAEDNSYDEEDEDHSSIAELFDMPTIKVDGKRMSMIGSYHDLEHAKNASIQKQVISKREHADVNTHTQTSIGIHTFNTDFQPVPIKSNMQIVGSLARELGRN